MDEGSLPDRKEKSRKKKRRKIDRLMIELRKLTDEVRRRQRKAEKKEQKPSYIEGLINIAKKAELNESDSRTVHAIEQNLKQWPIRSDISKLFTTITNIKQMARERQRNPDEEIPDDIWQELEKVQKDIQTWDDEWEKEKKFRKKLFFKQLSASDTTKAVGDHVSIVVDNNDIAEDAPILAGTALEISSENVGSGDTLRRKGSKEWIFPMVNFLIELLSATIDQFSSVHKPRYALIAMLMSFVGSIICIIELAYKATKERVVWRWESKLPWFYYPHLRNKRFGSVPDIIGLICAILQSISSAMVYTFYMRHADYPIKTSFWPIVFALCLLCSKFMHNPDQNNAFRED